MRIAAYLFLTAFIIFAVSPVSEAQTEKKTPPTGVQAPPANVQTTRPIPERRRSVRDRQIFVEEEFTAADMENYGRFLEILSKLNRIDPKQNPKYQKAADILDWRILDRKKKVIGELNDIVLTDSGNIQLLDVELDRLRTKPKISLDYNNTGITPASNGFIIGLDDRKIEELYPSLLAQIEPAAGQDENFSLRKIMGASVKSDKGRVIGKVNDVLFDSTGTNAKIILIELSQGKLRGDHIAVPFTNPVSVKGQTRKNIVLNETVTKAVLDFAKNN